MLRAKVLPVIPSCLLARTRSGMCGLLGWVPNLTLIVMRSSLLKFAFPRTTRWFSRGLDQLDIDLEASNASAESSSDDLLLKVTDQEEDGDLDKAVAIWSDHVDAHLLAHCQELHLPGRRYKGRCLKVTPRS